MSKTSFDEYGRFVIQDFTARMPFSSFLPGIAGPNGIPMWVFYVNRGQAIASFGVENKDHPMLEFQPANKAYRETPITGFRTFIKIHSGERPQIYEPFSSWQPTAKASRKMFIGMNELEIQEHHSELGLETNVLYFILPGESLAALVRQVTLTNLTDRTLNIELLDGLPAVIPFGVNNWVLKEISRTIEAWMAVYNLDHDVPFYRLRASTEDTVEVKAIHAGHFALSSCVLEGNTKVLSPIVDPGLVFGHNTALTAPDRFIENSLDQLLLERQFTSGKTPCGFFGTSISIPPSEPAIIYTIFGHLGNEEHLRQQTIKLRNPKLLEEKRLQARRLTNELTDAIATKTGSPVFDAYCRQTYLDNLVRGGWPTLLGNEDAPVVYHIYTRKHGDPERDYNIFNLAAEPYSQGDVSYRDVIQNRRSDVFFNPQVGNFNIRAFMSLIQADGYNPLIVHSVNFTLPKENEADILAQVDQPDKVRPILSQTFSPGELLKYIKDREISLQVSPGGFLTSVLKHADHHFSATHGEGYWVDHWTYNLDLIDSFLAVYPDRKTELFFGIKDLPFFDSPFIVKPRVEKYVLTEQGPRQFNSVIEDPVKASLIASRKELPNWVRAEHGHGEIYCTTLFAKLVVLAVIKFATMDPHGMGIEMEAGKPGWYDAMNGLPGLFGASMPESYALQRILSLLLEVSEGQTSHIVNLPIEVWKLMEKAHTYLQRYIASLAPDRDFDYWDAVSEAREGYRGAVRLGFDGREHGVTMEDLALVLEAFLEKVKLGAQRAAEYTDGVPPTYFAYRVEEYELVQGPRGENSTDEEDRPHLRVKRFIPEPLPLFLEGPVGALRVQAAQNSARWLFQQVRASPLYDPKLKMYKVNTSLEEQSHEIGRARAFTPGWLENESIWLHMEYKYLLEILKAGLYEEFFEDFKNVLIPFQDPKRYGRSPLENSSFLVSSAHPDEALHGAGFVSRLSGATAEFLSIWRLMMVGECPFFIHQGDLHLHLRPVLPVWLFTPEGTISFRFLGQTIVTYHNISGSDLLPGHKPNHIELTLPDYRRHTIDGARIPPPFAEQVRTGIVSRIEQFYV